MYLVPNIIYTIPLYGNMETVAFAPLRPTDDFLLESARFSPPNFSDLSRWNNRVLNNLIYYQTNYFLMTALVFLLVG